MSEDEATVDFMAELDVSFEDHRDSLDEIVGWDQEPDADLYLNDGNNHQSLNIKAVKEFNNTFGKELDPSVKYFEMTLLASLTLFPSSGEVENISHNRIKF